MSQRYTERLDAAIRAASHRLHSSAQLSVDEVDAAKDVMAELAAAMTGALSSDRLFIEGGRQASYRMGSTCGVVLSVMLINDFLKFMFTP